MRIEENTGQRTQADVSADSFRSRYERCTLCPRACGVNRNAGKTGFCRMDARMFGARAALHMWEEPCISGETGSGTVFFSGCTLGCIYCQNYEIARAQVGREVTVPRLAEIFLELQEKKAVNVNLVTPTHYAPSILEALKLARKQGLVIPAVYNCSGYESVEALRMLDGWIDIYLTDFKYMEPELAARYSRAADYPERAKEALAEMVRQTGEAVFEENGMMRRGTIVRHLLLPGHVRNAKEVVKYVFETYGNRVWISLMNQYTPVEKAERLREAPELKRKVTKREYEALVDYAVEIGVENGFIQEGETAEESFIPAFDFEGL
ncbi:MAG: radical SAM protein [Eubacteriales bacterium]|nr:radical SAM protein [Eubacteriales bacterium]